MGHRVRNDNLAGVPIVRPRDGPVLQIGYLGLFLFVVEVVVDASNLDVGRSCDADHAQQ